ncbi:MAG TPA: hypothetical protein VMA32_03060 [Streptosporangiaceae bacterium]|nr:hypothetical protein [Streptosporangiaceae bacterium]
MRLPTSLAVRIGTVAAAAAIAVTGATAAANASTATSAVHKIPTMLTISNTTPVAHPHQTTAIVVGHLTAGTYNLRHLRVWLERLGPKGHWLVKQTARTKPHGHVFFRVHIFAKPATFRLVFRGTHNFAKSVSLTDTISPATAS